MPKRKQRDLDKIKRKLRRLTERLEEMNSSSDSTSGSDSSSSDESDDPRNNTENNQEAITIAEIHPPPIEILGEDPLAPKTLGPEVHPEIANRWTTFSRKGIDKADRKSLSEKYPRPINAEGLLAPELNSEVVGCLTEAQIKQDRFLMRIQERVATAISALAKPMNLYFTEPSEGTAPHLQSLADATKLMSDVIYSLSAHRKYSLANSLDNSIRKVVIDRPTDTFLFGEDISTHIKSAQDIKKLSSELKIKPAQRATIKNPVPSTSRSSQDFLSRRYKYSSRKKPDMSKWNQKFKNQKRSDYRKPDYRKKH